MGDGSSSPAPAPAPGITPEQERGYLGSLNDQQVANIELQREGWDTSRITSASPIISNLINLNGQQTGLQGLSNQQKQIQASYVTQGGNGGNNYNQQATSLGNQIAAQQNQLNAVTNTPFTYAYTPTLTDQYVNPASTYQQQGNTGEYNAQTAFEQQEEGKNNSLTSQFGTADKNYMSLLDQYNQSLQNLQSQATEAQSENLANGAAQSNGQTVTGNQTQNTPNFTNSTSNASLNPKIQQLNVLGVAPLPTLQGLNNQPMNMPQGNFTGGTLAGITGNSNNINNT